LGVLEPATHAPAASKRRDETQRDDEQFEPHCCALLLATLLRLWIPRIRPVAVIHSAPDRWPVNSPTVAVICAIVAAINFRERYLFTVDPSANTGPSTPRTAARR